MAGGLLDSWDLLAVVAVVSLTNAAVFLLNAPAVVRLPLVLLLVSILPGYAVVSALFPGQDRSSGSFVPWSEATNAVTGAERVGLSIGLSVAVVGLLGLGLDFGGVGVGVDPFTGGVSLVTLGGCVVAAVRRRQLPTAERFVAPLPSLNDPLTRNDRLSTRWEAVLTALLVCSVAAAGVGLADGLARDSTPTAVSLLNENGDAAAYPTTVEAGEQVSFVLELTSGETTTESFTAVVVMEADGEIVERLTTLSLSVDPGASTSESITVTPTVAGDDLRLAVLVYRGDTPATPTIDGADRTVTLELTVTP